MQNFSIVGALPAKETDPQRIWRICGAEFCDFTYLVCMQEKGVLFSQTYPQTALVYPTVAYRYSYFFIPLTHEGGLPGIPTQL